MTVQKRKCRGARPAATAPAVYCLRMPNDVRDAVVAAAGNNSVNAWIVDAIEQRLGRQRCSSRVANS